MTEKKSVCDNRRKEKRKIHKAKRKILRASVLSNLYVKDPYKQDLDYYFTIGTTDHTRGKKERLASMMRAEQRDQKMIDN